MNFKFILSVSFFFPITVFAHLISISATSPFPASVPVSTTSTATFTVTNTTSRVPLTVIDQSQFPRGSGLSIIANTCGSLMAAGQSCVITLGLNAPATPQTIFGKLKEWAKPSADGVTFPFSVQIVSTPPPPAASTPWVAVGESFSDPSPLLAVSTDGANTWATNSITGFPTGDLNSATCVGTGASAICTVVGRGGVIPTLAVSADGGNSWAVKPIVGLPASGSFRSVGCTGSGATAVCTAAGTDFTAGLGLLVASIDGANNWAIQTIPGLPASSLFRGTSCTGSTGSAICAAVGGYGFFQVLLAVSTDGTSTWTLPAISGLPANGNLNGVSCTGSGASAICAAAGHAGIPPGGNIPLIIASLDGGNTWAVQSITGGPANGYFSDISCTGSGVCVAAGRELPGPIPLIVTSTDGGNTWTRQPIADPALGQFFAVSCTGSGSSAICAAAGSDATGTFPPLLVVSTDGGVTWVRKSITGLLGNGFFLGAKCTGTGASAICAVAGEDFDAETPLLAVSTDGANNWEVKAVTGTSIGSYNGVGSSNS